MKAGRDLDALVAERVMGWTRKVVTLAIQHGPDTTTKFDVEALVLGESIHRLDGYAAPYNVPGMPQYSTDQVAAMEVFEALRRSGKWCCLDIGSDYHYRWIVSLTPSITTLPDEERAKPAHKPTIIESAESLPLAICIAALKAVGAK